MTAVGLRGLLSRKLRTVLTMVAIILGVSMIVGTYVLTDTINNSFSNIFHQANRTTDAIVSGKTAVQSQFSLPPSLPASLLTIVSSTQGVAGAEGEIADIAQVFDTHGKALSGSRGSPTLLFSVAEPRFRRLSLVTGHWAMGQEVNIDVAAQQRSHLHVGQRVGIVAQHALQYFTIAGFVKFGTVGSLGGATLLAMDLATAQRVTNKVGRFDQIAVAASPGISQKEIVRRLRLRIPPNLRGSVQVKTSEQNATDQAGQIGNALNFLTIALLAFGGIAVFVGAFIIFNTFSITVAQRMREFALLRTIGATRGQILRSVILEALIIGVVASLLGLLAGLGIARGLSALFVAVGIDLPNAGMVIATRTVVVGLLVGTLVTLFAGLFPAIRATRVPPVAALREGFQLPRGRFARFTPLIATLLTLLGALLLLFGVFGSISSTGSRLSIIGLGAVVLFLGVAMISPQLVRPMASAIGWPIERVTDITGRLARENAVRNPTRTAVTAAALMIGLALVAFVTIFAAELKKTANDTINRSFAGDFAIYSQAQLIPQGVLGAVSTVQGVRTASAFKLDNARIEGIGTVQANGIQPANVTKLLRLQWEQGSDATVRGLGPYDAIVDDNFARDHHLTLGTRLHVTTTSGKRDVFRVAGIYRNTALLPTLAVPYATFGKEWGQTRDRIVLVGAAPGQDLKVLKARLTHVLKAQYPMAVVHSQQDVKDQNNQSVNQLLALIYVLLAMSVLVSLFGIINTLVLSVYERTREIGMLRAIGTTRKQVRWLIRWESVITSVIGAILGLALGIVLAVLVTAGLSSQGIEFAFPTGQLLLWVLFAIFFGIVAAAWPARRAAHLDVLRAVSYE
ncbi:MAG: ABC transporter permease [Chloroflexota bacterium]